MAEKKRGTFLSTTKIDLIYGTDSQMNTTTNSAEFKKSVHARWVRKWKLYVRDDTINLEKCGGLKG